jgi:hypothetical protein
LRWFPHLTLTFFLCFLFLSLGAQVLYDDATKQLDAETRRAEDDLEAHFASVQRICDDTALPAVVPRLKYALQSHLDLAAQLRILRAPSSGSVSSQHKLKAWEDLKMLAFTRVAASTLSLAILSLHMRVMLNILSRQLYLEHALQGTPGRDGRGLGNLFTTFSCSQHTS